MAKKSTVVVPQSETIAETPQSEVVVETPQSETIVKVVQKPKVGQRARELLLEGILDNKGILEQIKKEYPEAKTSIACIAWYKSDLKKKKPVDGYTQWLKANESKLRAEYESTLVTAELDAM